MLTNDERNQIIDSMGWSLDGQERSDMHKLIDAVLAKLAQQVPDGHVLVPVRATGDMIDAWDAASPGSFLSFSSKAYAAMLAAAPEAPAQDWTPTAENINALPEPVRKFVHELAPNCDPAGTVRDLTIARDTIRALEASNRMLRDAAPKAPVQFDWSRLPGYLIERYEGETLTEELLQRATAELAALAQKP